MEIKNFYLKEEEGEIIIQIYSRRLEASFI